MKDITVQELHEKLASNSTFLFIDVREPAEYEEDNLGAQLIPLRTLPSKLADLQKHRDDEIVIHCRSGARSGNAKQYLVQNGFTKVRNLLGGILEWNTYYGKDV